MADVATTAVRFSDCWWALLLHSEAIATAPARGAWALTRARRRTDCACLAKRSGRQKRTWNDGLAPTLGRCLYLWLEVPDAPGPDSERGRIERNAIALLSRCVPKTPDHSCSEWLRAERANIWCDGEFVAWRDATVHVLAQSLQRGSLAFDFLERSSSQARRGDVSRARPCGGCATNLW